MAEPNDPHGAISSAAKACCSVGCGQLKSDDENVTLDLIALAQRLSPGQRLIGIDLGSKTIGLALSDVSLTIASPLETLRRSKFSVDAAALLALAGRHGVGGLVIGHPLNLDGTRGPRAQATESFARNLERLTDRPIALWDERLSTSAVTRTLIEADASRRRRAELVDKMAAAYILQGALDRLRYGR
jgi:putative Holliday junction resolvase